MNNCVLCFHPLPGESLRYPNDQRTYLECKVCALMQVPEKYFPSPDEEKKRYLHHVSDAGSDGHICFIKKALSPARPFLTTDSKCLDYGCGPKPVLQDLLAEDGIYCDSYDPYFFPQLSGTDRYDHIFCLETAEHFFDPHKECTLLNAMLKPGGHITFMSEWYTRAEDMKDWYYKRDFTHVIFFHHQTWDYIGKTFAWRTVYSDHQRVIIFEKIDR
jgi:hypothetical protein